MRYGRKLGIAGETYLLTSVNVGVNIRDKFIEKCQNNSQRIEGTITAKDFKLCNRKLKKRISQIK